MADGFNILGGIFGAINSVSTFFSSGSETIGDFQILKSYYEQPEKNTVSFGLEEGGNKTVVQGAKSLFSPFSVFRYSKFGTADSYDISKHIDNFSAPAFGITKYSENPADQQKFVEFEGTQIIENPSAAKIVAWAKSRSKEDKGAVPLYPYSETDFMWCTHYGKVPNNRLVTLRRYPIPVEDNLSVMDSKNLPLVPIAQAVTWFGSDVNNPLSSILGLNWGFNWKQIAGNVQDINGNEIRLDDILNASTSSETTKNTVKAFFASDNQDVLAIMERDKQVQEYVRNAYGSEGPYWNRVLGPINVVDQVLKRDRGFLMQNDFTLEFKYSLRSYNQINPKIAFLDLISNFMALTYSNAPFWGGGYRYFKKTGLTIGALSGTEFLEKGDIIGGISEMVKGIAPTLNQGTKELNDALTELMKGFTGKPMDQKTKSRLETKIGAFIAKAAKNLVPDILSYRSILDGRAVGEWHVTIGNPMNPIAVIGNLCVDKVTMAFNDELGIDDFPTEVTFKVTLKHGRQRAKQDLERIFNYGNGGMRFTQLAPPSSSNNTYGEKNSQIANTVNPQKPNTANASNTNAERATSAVSNQSLTAEQIAASGGKTSKLYEGKIKDMYGNAYSESGILPVYFTNIVTKD